MTRVRALWRHPIKGHGREHLDQVDLVTGQTMPWDRRWAVAHELSEARATEWSACQNFSRGSKVPALMAINAQTDAQTGRVTLRHPDLPELHFDPDHEQAAFLEWVRPLMPANRAQSTRLIRVPERGMTDTDYPSVSLVNLGSNDALSHAMDTDVSALRWRANIHFDGLPAWDEFSWVGKTLRLGSCEMRVVEPIERCLATTANPATGQRDLDTLKTLTTLYNHQDFGIYAEVIKGGSLSVGDRIEVL